jgi:hypothetical protein
MNGSPKLNTHLCEVKEKTILHCPSRRFCPQLTQALAEERGTNDTQLSQVLPSSLVLFA